MTRSNPTKMPGQAHADPSLERDVITFILLTARDFGPAALPILERDVIQAPAELMSEPAHQAVWQAIRHAVDAGQVPTPFELRLRAPGVCAETWRTLQEPGEVAQLADNLTVLARLAGARRVHAAAAAAQAALKAGHDPEAVSAGLAQALDAADPASTRPQHVSTHGSVVNHLKALSEGRIPRIPTGFKQLDARLGGGLELATYVLLGMPTNVGKTRLALAMVLHQLKLGNGVTYVTGEMKSTAGGEDATHRIKMGLVLMIAGVAPTAVGEGVRISEGTLARLEGSEAWLNAAPLHIHDRDMSIDTIASIARRMKREGQTLMVLDNLNHVTMPGLERRAAWDEKNTISERLAEIAHSTGVIILTLMQTQISSKIQRPANLDEISDSKGIARPADLIITAWRPLLPPDGSEPEFDAPPLNRGAFYIAKKRQGRGGTVRVGWDEQMATWYDLEADV